MNIPDYFAWLKYLFPFSFEASNSQSCRAVRLNSTDVGLWFEEPFNAGTYHLAVFENGGCVSRHPIKLSPDTTRLEINCPAGLLDQVFVESKPAKGIAFSILSLANSANPLQPPHYRIYADEGVGLVNIVKELWLCTPTLGKWNLAFRSVATAIVLVGLISVLTSFLSDPESKEITNETPIFRQI